METVMGAFLSRIHRWLFEEVKRPRYEVQESRADKAKRIAIAILDGIAGVILFIIIVIGLCWIWVPLWLLAWFHDGFLHSGERRR
jgi:hypothetical protein